ncbi:hypothetical protein C8J57DRAFT_1305426 [Mycena rebaudengoi]|nr:hypothetical protein C8J57DRAFT_1305426 [Mycena rebaudengoi]
MSRVVRAAGKFMAYTSLAGAAGFGGFFIFARKSHFVPFAVASDPIFTSAHFKKFNPHQNAATIEDLCVRRVPLDQIKPELLKEEGKLVEQFCAGAWSGFGYALQRRLLERTHRSPETEGQLWDTGALAESAYPIGTLITDHFEVIARTPSTISLRFGDSPRNNGLRAFDGIFELSAVVKQSEGVAEFGLKSISFQGEGKSDGSRIPPLIVMAAVKLHEWYTKLLMESALKKVMK